ncbi:septum formation initiator family protein [Rhodococcus rhodnii]|uniref:septum formation initiator family protein n=1 Tax=Rhodococcus rhodnii TaxID=38312 RepID=UPI0005947CD6|nr:septum formation initiator family protein [Rhodococcus rhodnii]
MPRGATGGAGVPRPAAARRSRTTRSGPGGGRSDGAPTSESGSVLPGRAGPRRVGAARNGKARPPTENTVFGLSTGKALTLAVVVLALALTLAMPLRTYLTQRSDMQRVEAERVQLEHDLAELRELRERYDDPAYIEAEARKRLRFVRPGDTAYQVQLPGDYQEPERRADEEAELTGPWYSVLWQSIESTPEPDEPPPPPAPAPDAAPPETRGVPAG